MVYDVSAFCLQTKRAFIPVEIHLLKSSQDFEGEHSVNEKCSIDVKPPQTHSVLKNPITPVQMLSQAFMELGVRRGPV